MKYEAKVGTYRSLIFRETELKHTNKEKKEEQKGSFVGLF